MFSEYYCQLFQAQDKYNWLEQPIGAGGYIGDLADAKQKPRLYVAKSLGNGWLGVHEGRDGQMHKINGRWLLNSSHIITIRADHLTSDRLLNTIRHEICHVLQHNHRQRFWQLLALLTRQI